MKVLIKRILVITIYDKKDLLVGFELFIYNKNLQVML